MRQTIIWLSSATLSLMLSLALSGCDGGDGGGAPAPPALAPQSVSTATSSVQNAINGFGLGLGAIGSGDIGGFSSPRAFGETRAQDLVPSVARVYRALRIRRANPGAPRVVESCPNGGTVDVNETAAGFMATFDSCRIRFDGDEDGNAEADFFFQNFTLTASIDDTTFCGGEEVPAVFTLVLSGLFSGAIDENDDGVPETNASVDFTGFTITVAGSVFDPIFCTPDTFMASEFGALSVTDNLETDESFSLTIPRNTPVVVTVATVTDGINVTIEGSYSFSSACFSGSLTVATTETIFLPISSGDEVASCPTAGVVAVTGDLTGTIIFTDTGGVEIDNGSDGTVDESFEDCNAVEVCV